MDKIKKKQRKTTKLCRVVLFLSFILFSACFSATRQAGYISEQQGFSFELSNVMVKDVFSYIEKNSDYVFLYSNDKRISDRISLKVKNETIVQIMDRFIEKHGSELRNRWKTNHFKGKRS